MMADEHHYVYTGEDVAPEDATHVSIHESITVIPEHLFSFHPNIVELICHDRVNKIEYEAFYHCPRLKRLIMPGVEEVEGYAFCGCEAIARVECQKLKRIGEHAFSDCESVSNIDLSSAQIIEEAAFIRCGIHEAKFGNELEVMEKDAFDYCESLQRITIPLRTSPFADDSIFRMCSKLKRVDAIEGPLLHETIDALMFDKWKDDMNREMDSINQILPTLDNGGGGGNYDPPGEKARTIREWITRLNHKINRYKEEHCRLLTIAATEVGYASSSEVVVNNVLSFLQLPTHTFEGEDNIVAPIPSYDQQSWENAVQRGQRIIDMEREILALRAANEMLVRENNERRESFIS